MSADLADAAYRLLDSADRSAGFRSGALTRGPWHPDHQHAGPPCALVCGEIERAASAHGLAHVGRLTANLLRPVPLAGTLRVEVRDDYVGRNAGHFSARLLAGDREIARFTALALREADVPVPPGTAGHPPPAPPRQPLECPVATMPVFDDGIGYHRLIENRIAAGELFRGPTAAWFRLLHPIVDGEAPSAYQRVAVAADSGNGISAVLDFSRYLFVNCDLTINLLRRPVGEWILLDARTLLGGNGGGLAESTLYDETGLVGRATQSLAVRLRD
jgi:hypothetical protein